MPQCSGIVRVGKSMRTRDPCCRWPKTKCLSQYERRPISPAERSCRIAKVGIDRRNAPMTDRTVYCHGLPGSPGELPALAPSLAPGRVLGLARLDQPHPTLESRVLAAFDALKLDGPVHVAGFSLGAMSAVILAARRAHQVRKLTLMSPAAPLELGDFLDGMAGRPVFEAAQRGAVSLGLLTALQSAVMRVAPMRLLDVMFAKSPDADRQLLASPEWADAILTGMRTCLSRRSSAYRAELREYVRPWAHLLDAVNCETEIWQGSADDWTPPAIANALKQRMGERARVKLCEGLGHYSTLRAAALEL